jgi:plasmid maintenance system antidote protein VapI
MSQIIAKELKRRMAQGKFNYAQLAAAVGISRQYLNEIIHGRKGLSVNICRGLVKVFGETVEYWMALNSKWKIHRG